MLGKLFAGLVESGLIRLLVFAQTRQMKRQDPARRGQHPKHQGCVWGTFTIDENLPEPVRVGIFAEARSYDVVIRFSNGAAVDDRTEDVHGMAIKLLDVAGQKLLDSERNASTQDFVLADFPVFFARDVKHLLQFARAKKKGKQGKALYESHPAFEGFFHQPQESPLAAAYWSQTPYKLGSQAVKYSVKPAEDNALGETDRSTADFLREAMVRRLADNQPNVRFDFFVQQAPDANPKWVDDPTIEWTEEISPPIRVATISIPPQKFDSDQQMSFCEALSFTPWHSLPAHEPLGQINRAPPRLSSQLATSSSNHASSSAGTDHRGS